MIGAFVVKMLIFAFRKLMSIQDNEVLKSVNFLKEITTSVK